MAEESQTSAAASCGGNWWNAVSTGSGSSLVFNIHRQQEAANWSSSCSGIPTSVTAIGSEEVDNLPGTLGSDEADNLSGTILTGGGGSSSTTTSSTLSSMSTEGGSMTRRRQQQEQELVDSASFLEQFAVHGGVSDNQNIWSQVLLGGSESSSQGMNNHLHLQETLYTTALGQELDLVKNEPQPQPQPCSHRHQLKKGHDNISAGWEFRNLGGASFQADDMSMNMNMNLKTQMSPAVAPPLLYSMSGGSSSHPLPDLGSWSAALPEQAVNVLSRNINMNSINSLNAAFSNSNSSEGSSDLNMAQFDVSRIKQEFPVPPYTGSLGVSLNSPNTRLLQGFGANGESDFKNDSSFSHILDPATTKPFLKSMATIGGGGWPSNSSNCLSQPLPSSSSRPSVLSFGNLDFLACKSNQMKRQHAHVTTAERSIQLYPDKKQIQTVLPQNRTVPNGDEARDSTTDTKRSSCTDQNAGDTVFKRPRLETSSTIPTFKVRKEKLGDRITALQQIVSPFGKTDTASVLLEAIGYIKFLQEQVQVLSTPYMKSGGTSNQGEQKVWGPSDRKDTDEPNSDLRSRGLCLVPVSCTLHVANDNGADYWTPSLGGTYR